MKRLVTVVGAAEAGAAATLAVIYGPALVRYIAFGVQYGDWLNAWLTHLPAFVQAAVLALAGIA